MSLAIEKILVPATGRPARPATEETNRRLNRRRLHVGGIDAGSLEGSRHSREQPGRANSTCCPSGSSISTTTGQPACAGGI